MNFILLHLVYYLLQSSPNCKEVHLYGTSKQLRSELGCIKNKHPIKCCRLTLNIPFTGCNNMSVLPPGNCYISSATYLLKNARQSQQHPRKQYSIEPTTQKLNLVSFFLRGSRCSLVQKVQIQFSFSFRPGTCFLYLISMKYQQLGLIFRKKKKLNLVIQNHINTRVPASQGTEKNTHTEYQPCI